MIIEIAAGNAILGAPTVGKTTLCQANPDIEILDQDEVKIELNGAVNPFPKKRRPAMWAKLATILAEGGAITYSDFDESVDSQDSNARYVRDNTVLAVDRPNKDIYDIMLKRDGDAHADTLTWKFDWYKRLSPVIIHLARDQYLGDQVFLTDSIKRM